MLAHHHNNFGKVTPASTPFRRRGESPFPQWLPVPGPPLSLLKIPVQEAECFSGPQPKCWPEREEAHTREHLRPCLRCGLLSSPAPPCQSHLLERSIREQGWGANTGSLLLGRGLCVNLGPLGQLLSPTAPWGKTIAHSLSCLFNKTCQGLTPGHPGEG